MANDTGHIGDGYHTFDEIYEHRVSLWIALCRTQQEGIGKPQLPPWRSKLHSDGTFYENWFVLGMGKEAGKQMTYHIPLYRWNETDFAEDLERAPEFDGHTPADVLERLRWL